MVRDTTLINHWNACIQHFTSISSKVTLDRFHYVSNENLIGFYEIIEFDTNISLISRVMSLISLKHSNNVVRMGQSDMKKNYCWFAYLLTSYRVDMWEFFHISTILHDKVFFALRLSIFFLNPKKKFLVLAMQH